MFSLSRMLWEDEAGAILSAELIIIATIAVLGMVTGLSCFQSAILAEFTDLSAAFRSLNQSYSTPFHRGCWKWWGGRTSWVAGSCFVNVVDCYGANGYYGGDIGANGYYLPSSATGVTVQTPAAGADLCPQGSTVQPAPTAAQPCPTAVPPGATTVQPVPLTPMPPAPTDASPK